MSKTWLIGAGVIAGLGLYLNSLSDSPSDEGESNTELENSDKPSWSKLYQKNPDFYTGYKGWWKTFTTSCGWTDDEQYCPDSIIAENGCSTACVGSLVPYRNIKRGAGDWTSECSNADLGSGFCVGMEIVNPTNCQPLRFRLAPTYTDSSTRQAPQFVSNDNFWMSVQGQVFGLYDIDYEGFDSFFYGWTHPSEYEGYEFLGWDRPDGAGPRIQWRSVQLMGGDNNLTLFSYEYDGETDSWDLSGQPGMNNHINFRKVCPDKKCSLGRGEAEQMEAFVNMGSLDNSDGFYNGVYNLKIVGDITRCKEWGDTGCKDDALAACELHKEVTLEVPNYVVIYSEEVCGDCKDGILLPLNADIEEYEIMKKYNYLEVDAGKMSQRSAYNEAPNDSKCKSSGGINCSSDTASQTNNAETIFPRNGFMQW